jgi:hypothetical protein
MGDFSRNSRACSSYELTATAGQLTYDKGLASRLLRRAARPDVFALQRLNQLAFAIPAQVGLNHLWGCMA